MIFEKYIRWEGCMNEFYLYVINKLKCVRGVSVVIIYDFDINSCI